MKKEDVGNAPDNRRTSRTQIAKSQGSVTPLVSGEDTNRKNKALGERHGKWTVVNSRGQ